MKKMLTMIVALLMLGVFTPNDASASMYSDMMTTGSDAMVYIGDTTSDMYTETLNGILSTEDQIGFMADRILWTEEQIGVMADRIVYVTEFSEDNSVEVIYEVTEMPMIMTDYFGHYYALTLSEVTSLPENWQE